MTTRVLYLVPALSLGGTEGQLVQLCVGLDRGRFEPIVCSLSVGGANAAALRARGVAVQEFAVRGSAPWRAAVELSRLIGFMAQVRPDIVHGLLFWGYVLGGLTRPLVRSRAVVASRRSLGFFKKDKPHYALLERLANRMTDLVVANSESVRRDAIESEGLAPESVLVVRNGVELVDVGDRNTVRAALGIAEDLRLVVVVANLLWYKGHETFLRAWQQVRVTRTNALAVLIGAGPLRSQLQRLVNELALDDVVRFLGERSDVPDWIAAADVVCLPSLSEGSSNAVLEGMAAGKPVIASAVGGNSEAVVHRETGFLVAPQDIAGLAGALLSVLDSPAAAIEMGLAARRRVAERYAMRDMVHRYEQIYEEALSHSTAAH